MPRKPHSRITDGVFAAVIRDYMRTSPKWLQPPPVGYSDATKGAWKRELDLAARPEILGAKSIFEMRPALTQAFLDGLANRPGKQANAYTALKQLEKWAMVRDRLPHHIMTGVEVAGVQGGHRPWPDDRVELAERHARADFARVVTLAANTGQRESDLVKMRWSDIEIVGGRPGINVVQKKTNKQLWIPFTRQLAGILDTWQLQPGFILRNLRGDQWNAQALSSAWRHHRRANKALELLQEEGLVLHGLRATACVRLNQSGANTRQISDWVGMSERTVERYLRFSIQKENALAAVVHLDRFDLGRKLLKNNGA